MTDRHAPAPESQASRKTLILGVGNTLLADEAAGPRAVSLLESDLGGDERLSFLDGGTLSFTLALPIGEHEQLIVLDAARMGCAPGTVQVFEGEAMDRQLRGHATSVHEVSLADLLDMVRLTDKLPVRRALIGIEPELIDWRDGLSAAVEAALPDVLARVRELLTGWDLASDDSD